MENPHVYQENSLCLWPCSIAILKYQRVYPTRYIPREMSCSPHDLDPSAQWVASIDHNRRWYLIAQFPN